MVDNVNIMNHNNIEDKQTKKRGRPRLDNDDEIRAIKQRENYNASARNYYHRKRAEGTWVHNFKYDEKTQQQKKEYYQQKKALKAQENKKRGRPALTEEERQKRNSSSSTDEKRKRGRPAISEEDKIKREEKKHIDTKTTKAINAIKKALEKYDTIDKDTLKNYFNNI